MRRMSAQCSVCKAPRDARGITGMCRSCMLPPVAPRPCKACGVPVKNRSWCSDECKHAYRVFINPPKPRLCNHCNGPIPIEIRYRVTCSDACRDARALAASNVGCRSDTYRAIRRESRRHKYRRPDKPAVIADLMARQNGRCASCGGDGGQRGLVLDHCHASGEPRAMLCTQCNAALGMLHESPTKVRCLGEYAQHWADVALRHASNDALVGARP